MPFAKLWEVPHLAEAVRGYQRWQGQVSTKSRILTVAIDELARARRSTWTSLVALSGLAWGMASTVELYQFRNSGSPHTIDSFAAMLDQLRWFVLGLAAVVGAPALLEDHRRGALELYLSRPLTKWDYLAGKALAVLALCFGVFVISIGAYTAASYVFYSSHPGGWLMAPLLGLLYAFVWVFMVAGLALGISCVAQGGRAASIIIFGSAVVLHVTATTILPQLTGTSWLGIFSPFQAHEAIKAWFWNSLPHGAFPPWWGLTEILAIAALGWGLVVWKHPRLRGEDQ